MRLLEFWRIWRNQWLPKEELEKQQIVKLRKLLMHAQEFVPYYQELFKKLDFDAKELKSLDDLKRLPIMSKKDVVKAGDRLISRYYKKEELILKRTTGTTGPPLKIYYKRNDFTKKFIDLRIYMAHDYNPFDRTVLLKNPELVKWPKSRIQNFLFKKFVISNFESAQKQIEFISKVRPDVIESYPTSFLILAHWLMSNPTKLPKYPKFILCLGELLTENMKEQIEKAFDSSIVNTYGSSECSTIAWECKKHEGYHINIDTHVIEIKGKSSNRGSIVATNLHNYAFPLIRYNLKDQGILKNKMCSCGRGLPLIMNILGRENDFIISQKNEKVSPFLVTGFFLKENVHDYRIIQNKDFSLEISVVKNKKYNKDNEKKYRKKIQEKLGKLPIQFKYVKEIPPDPSGKLRRVISKCHS